MRGNKIGGFTLLELMIVVAVVAILAALAYSNYSRYGFRARRPDGQNLLQNLATAEERYYTNFNKYTANITGAAPAGLALSTTSERGYYTATVAVGAGNQTYTLTATPTAGQPQVNDQCANLTLDNAGKKGYSGPGGNGNCW